jgi:WD40 repeat protein
VDKLGNVLSKLLRGILIASATLITLCLIAYLVLLIWQPDLSGSWMKCDALTEAHGVKALDPFPVTSLELAQSYPLDIDMEGAQSISLSPDLRLVALTRTGSVEIWDIQSGQLNTQIDVESEEIHPLTWSLDSRYLAYGVSGYQQPHELGQYGTLQWDNYIEVWDVEADEQVLVLEGSSGSIDNFDFIGAIYFSPDNDLLVAESGNGFYVWDMKQGEKQCDFHQNSIFWDSHTEEMLLSLGWQVDGPPLIAGQVTGRGIPTNSTSIWRINHGISLVRINTEKDLFVGAVWSENSSYIALISSGAAYGVSPDRTTIWSIPEDEMLLSLEESYRFLSWSPDEQKILVENGPTIEIWDVLTAQRSIQAEIGESSIIDGQWSRDGQTIALLLKNGMVQFWSIK